MNLLIANFATQNALYRVASFLWLRPGIPGRTLIVDACHAGINRLRAKAYLFGQRKLSEGYASGEYTRPFRPNLRHEVDPQWTFGTMFLHGTRVCRSLENLAYASPVACQCGYTFVYGDNYCGDCGRPIPGLTTKL